MKIPKSLKIGVHNCKVLMVDKVDADESGNRRCLGMLFGDYDKLELLKTMPESKMAETFLHEIIHAANNFSGSCLTEKQVNGIGASLFMILRENKLDFSKAK